jgi:hypothetical protein
MRYVLATALMVISFVVFHAAAQQTHECQDKPGLAHKVDCLIVHVAKIEDPLQRPSFIHWLCKERAWIALRHH